MDFNERNIIYSYLTIINSLNMTSQFTKLMLEKYFSYLRFVRRYEKLETKHGELTAYKLDSGIMNSPLIPIIKNQHLARQSHQVIENYSHLVTNGFAITSEIVSSFSSTK